LTRNQPIKDAASHPQEVDNALLINRKVVICCWQERLTSAFGRRKGTLRRRP